MKKHKRPYREEELGLDAEFASLMPVTIHRYPWHIGAAVTSLEGHPPESLADALMQFEGRYIDRSFGKWLGPFVKAGATPNLDLYQLVYESSAEMGRPRPQRPEYLNVHFDGQFNFCLFYDKEVISWLGFEARDGLLFINQIQGNKPAGEDNHRWEKLRPIKWERALVRYAETWARQYSIPEIGVQGAINNKQPLLREDPHAHMLYDVTAKRCGFRPIKNDGNYYKVLR
jgi:hypothetical protein